MLGSTPDFVQTSNPNLSNGSSLQRRIFIPWRAMNPLDEDRKGLTANDLIELFGMPPGRQCLDGKVTLEWHFLDTYGRLVTLYDYKQNAVDDLDRLITWSIGGFDPEPARNFEAWLALLIHGPPSTQCTHCNGFGSSLKEDAATCTKCSGTGWLAASIGGA
jgi:hypothetical protein